MHAYAPQSHTHTLYIHIYRYVFVCVCMVVRSLCVVHGVSRIVKETILSAQFLLLFALRLRVVVYVYVGVGVCVCAFVYVLLQDFHALFFAAQLFFDAICTNDPANNSNG